MGALILVFLGVLALYAGSELLVWSASKIALSYGFPPLLIGVTIVAFGTSLPEFFVSLVSSLHNEQEIIISNVLGSNMFNIAFIFPIFVMLAQKRDLIFLDNHLLRLDIPMMFMAGPSILLVFHFGYGQVSRIEAIVLLLLFFLYFRNRIRSCLFQKKGRGIERGRGRLLLVYFFCIILGGYILHFGGTQTLKGGIWLAENIMHIDRHILGSTIIAFGTGLPEFFTSVIALIRKKAALSLGNLIGSNIFNSFFILGSIGLLSPINMRSSLYPDILALILVSFILWTMVRIKQRIPPSSIIPLLSVFACYMYYLFMQNNIA